MKLVKRFVRDFFFLVLILLCYSALSKMDAYAGEFAPYVIVSSYDVTNDLIVPGEEFEINIKIKNVDAQFVAENVVVSVETMTGINSIYPSVPQVYVGNVGPQEERVVSFSYMIDSQYRTSTTSFYVTIGSDLFDNSVVLSAPVIVDDSAFVVLSKNVPTEGVLGEKISASLYFRVTGGEALSNVLTRTVVDGEEILNSSIGSVLSGASKTQNIIFSIGDIGKHNIVIEIEGIDQNGEVKVTEAYNGNIEITEASSNLTEEVDNTVVNIRSKRDYLIMGGAGFLIVLFVAGIVFVLRIKNK